MKALNHVLKLAEQHPVMAIVLGVAAIYVLKHPSMQPVATPQQLQLVSAPNVLWEVYQ